MYQRASEGLEPQILSRCPPRDYKDYPLAPGIAAFAFPEGFCVGPRQSPRLFSFVATSVDGTKQYGSCLLFYESIRGGALIGTPNDMTTGVTMAAPKVILLVSHHAYLGQMRRLLRLVYRASLCRRQPYDAERVLWLTTRLIPVPRFAFQRVELRLYNQTIAFQGPGLVAEERIPVLHSDIGPLLNFVSHGHIISSVGLLLTECKLVLVSAHTSVLVHVAESLKDLLYPFRWHSVYIPLLPLIAKEVLAAPVPYIVGLTPTMLAAAVGVDGIAADVALLDIDKGVLEMPNPPTPLLPKKLCQRILNTLLIHDPRSNERRQMKTFAAKLRTSDAAFAKGMEFKRLDVPENAIPVVDRAAHNMDAAKDRTRFLKIRCAFVEAYADLFRGLDRFVEAPPLDQKNSFARRGEATFPQQSQAVFRDTPFLRSRPHGARDFMSRVVQTMAFSEFAQAVAFEPRSARVRALTARGKRGHLGRMQSQASLGIGGEGSGAWLGRLLGGALGASGDNSRQSEFDVAVESSTGTVPLHPSDWWVQKFPRRNQLPVRLGYPDYRPLATAAYRYPLLDPGKYVGSERRVLFEKDRAMGFAFLDNIVHQVRPGTPAEAKGVRVGWSIMAVDGWQAPVDQHDLMALIVQRKKSHKSEVIRVAFATRGEVGTARTPFGAGRIIAMTNENGITAIQLPYGVAHIHFSLVDVDFADSGLDRAFQLQDDGDPGSQQEPGPESDNVVVVDNEDAHARLDKHCVQVDDGSLSIGSQKKDKTSAFMRLIEIKLERARAASRVQRRSDGAAMDATTSNQEKQQQQDTPRESFSKPRASNPLRLDLHGLSPRSSSRPSRIAKRVHMGRRVPQTARARSRSPARTKLDWSVPAVIGKQVSAHRHRRRTNQEPQLREDATIKPSIASPESLKAVGRGQHSSDTSSHPSPRLASPKTPSSSHVDADACTSSDGKTPVNDSSFRHGRELKIEFGPGRLGMALRGCLVTQVIKDSQAHFKGLQPGMQLVSINGVKASDDSDDNLKRIQDIQKMPTVELVLGFYKPFPTLTPLRPIHGSDPLLTTVEFNILRTGENSFSSPQTPRRGRWSIDSTGTPRGSPAAPRTSQNVLGFIPSVSPWLRANRTSAATATRARRFSTDAIQFGKSNPYAAYIESLALENLESSHGARSGDRKRRYTATTSSTHLSIPSSGRMGSPGSDDEIAVGERDFDSVGSVPSVSGGRRISAGSSRGLDRDMTFVVAHPSGAGMREGIGLDSTYLATIPRNTRLTAEEKVGRRVRVTFRGRTGWVSRCKEDALPILIAIPNVTPTIRRVRQATPPRKPNSGVSRAITSTMTPPPRTGLARGKAKESSFSSSGQSAPVALIGASQNEDKGSTTSRFGTSLLRRWLPKRFRETKYKLGDRIRMSRRTRRLQRGQVGTVVSSDAGKPGNWIVDFITLKSDVERWSLPGHTLRCVEECAEDMFVVLFATGQQMGMAFDDNAVVIKVSKESQAERKGVKTGWVITRVNGKHSNQSEPLLTLFKNALTGKSADRGLPVVVEFRIVLDGEDD